MKNKFSLEGKTAIVTGGARGIGKVVASEMALAGADLALVDVLLDETKETAAQIAKEHGVTVKAYKCDVTNPDEVSSTMDAIAKDFGKLDVLFNNAGVVLHKPALEVTAKEWLDVIDVNLNGVFYMSVAFAKKLIEQKRPGSIINNASMSGTIVNWPQKQASYNVSKSATIHLTKSLAVEWTEHNIRVNSLSPGYTETDLTVHVRKDWIEAWKEQTPMKRMAQPEELAGAVIYLASDYSTFTNGCDIIVDGAFCCV